MIGKKLKCLKTEAGGHRIQRVPPTETRGRVHTSTVTVSVVDESVDVGNSYDQIDDKDFRIEWFSGTGKGGQHRNKHQNSCRVFHIPTGLMESRQGRKRESNLKGAKEAIVKRLRSEKGSAIHSKLSSVRKDQVGSGMRGDKIRTYRFQEDRVIDHQLDKSSKLKKIMSGGMNVFWKDYE